MEEITKPIVLDFGRYTQWVRPDNPPGPIDAVICGVSSGNYKVQTYDANVPHIQAERRKMTYHFYEPWYSAQTQADIYSECIEGIEPQRIWIDWEEYRDIVFGQADVTRIGSIWDILGKRYGFDKVGVYANISDLYTIAQYKPGWIAEIPLWIAYPVKEGYANHLRTDYDDWPTWGDKLRALKGWNRDWSTVELIQFDWWADAQAYGAVNEKKSMDRSAFLQGDLKAFDIWLGLEPEQPEDNGGIDMPDMIKLDQILANQAVMMTNQKIIIAGLAGGAVVETPEDNQGEQEEPANEVQSNLWQFSRSTGSRATKIFKLVDKGNGKVGIAEEFGENQIYGIDWAVVNGDIVEELSIEGAYPGYGLASNTAPAESWDNLKYVRLKKTGNDGIERYKDGLIVRGFNDGVFKNVGSGKIW